MPISHDKHEAGTPRTDAVTFRRSYGALENLARQLERELADALSGTDSMTREYWRNRARSLEANPASAIQDEQPNFDPAKAHAYAERMGLPTDFPLPSSVEGSAPTMPATPPLDVLSAMWESVGPSKTEHWKSGLDMRPVYLACRTALLRDPQSAKGD